MKGLDLEPGQSMTVDPGGVVVVGPGGYLSIACNAEGKFLVFAHNCDFIGACAMSEAHRDLVDERWGLWDDLGANRIEDSTDG